MLKNYLYHLCYKSIDLSVVCTWLYGEIKLQIYCAAGDFEFSFQVFDIYLTFLVEEILLFFKLLQCFIAHCNYAKMSV